MSEEAKKIDAVELYSEQVREVLSQPPRSIFQWGNTIIFFAIVALLVLTWIVRFPDIVTAEITVTTQNPPIRIVSETAGQISELYVQDNQQVQQKEVLGLIRNTTSFDAIKDLKVFLKHPAFDSLAFYPELLFNQALELGTLQTAYNDLEINYAQYHLQLRLKPQSRETISIRKQLEGYRILLNQQITKLQIYEDEIALIDKNRIRYQQLRKDTLISVEALEQQESNYLMAQRNREDLKIDIANTKLNIAELEKSIIQLGITEDQTLQQLAYQVKVSHKRLSTALNQWENTFLLKAPIAGRISFFNYWTDKQFIKQGEEIFTIVPNDENKALLGKVLMPIYNSGKVRKGQEVNIKLIAYPDKEFGSLKGIVKNISLVPQNGFYAIEVGLPDGLKTKFGKELVFRQEMQGTAEIVTEELRLLERIFYEIRNIFSS